MSKLTNIRIAGVAVVLFSAVLLAVGIHHLVKTGNCSSTGYLANFGPVQKCPSGTGWWFLFVFGGIIGCLIGAAMAASLGLVFASIFGAIGIGALSLAFDSSAQSSSKLFGAIFGGCFALVGLIAGGFVLAGALGALREGGGRPRKEPRAKPGASPFGASEAASAFGGGAQVAPATATVSAPAAPAPAPAGSPSPLDLVPGLTAATQRAADSDAVDGLAKLAELHEKGVLTDAEFASAKAKLLGKM